MPKVSDTPKNLKPYLFLGVDVEHDGGKNAVGDCPFCDDGEGKFGIEVETSKYNCFKCKTKGNASEFIRQYYDLCVHYSGSRDLHLLKELAKGRGLLDEDTLIEWGVLLSTHGDWLVPGHGQDGALNTLYKYATVRANGHSRQTLLTPPEANHQLFGMPLFEMTKRTIYVCEGAWDGMALWEMLGRVKQVDGKLSLTGNTEESLLADANVIAIPGTNCFFERWCPLFEGKRVVFLFDSDHPGKDRAGREIPPAGLQGLKHALAVMGKSGVHVEEVDYLDWGDLGYDPDLPSGTDIRDILKQGKTPSERIKYLGEILGKIKPVPSEFVQGRSPTAPAGKIGLSTLECRSWDELRNSWKHALKWTDDLDRVLSIMLSSVLSTPMWGDQLWLKVIGPPASGKSTLCEALAVATTHVKSLSRMTGFHSGYKKDKTGKEDVSLLARIKNKTLVVKDGDTLLNEPNLPQILSEARDIYDRVSRVHYRHGLDRDYENFSLTWILCGTNAMRYFDASELGQRFLDVVLYDDIPDDLEDDVGMKALHKLKMMLGPRTPEMHASTEDTPEMIEAKRLTGGYVEHLRARGEKLVEKITESLTDSRMREIRALGTFVAYLRARPSKKQDEDVSREFSSRLIGQLGRLACCLAVVMNQDSINEKVMARVRQTAMDTARGRTLRIVEYLHTLGEKGAVFNAILTVSMETEDALRKLLRFLCRIHALKQFTVAGKNNLASHPRWRLSDRMQTICNLVIGKVGS